jgi:hypothetical protein
MITQSQPSRSISRTHSMIRPCCHLPPTRTQTAAWRGAVRRFSRRCQDRRGGRQAQNCSPYSVCESALEKSSAGSAYPRVASEGRCHGLGGELLPGSARKLASRMEFAPELGIWRARPGAAAGYFGHAMLAVRAVNDHCEWPCSAAAHATVLWHGPGPGTDQDCSDISQPVPELLTRHGSDGWELVAFQEHREGGLGTFLLGRPVLSRYLHLQAPIPSPG